MARDLEHNIYIPVPLRKDSPILARLKAEAGATAQTKRVALGPFIAELLASRYGVSESGLWALGSVQQVQAMIQEAVQQALSAVSLTPAVVEQEVAEQELIEQEAAALADAWGEDDWDSLEG